MTTSEIVLEMAFNNMRNAASAGEACKLDATEVRALMALLDGVPLQCGYAHAPDPGTPGGHIYCREPDTRLIQHGGYGWIAP